MKKEVILLTILAMCFSVASATLINVQSLAQINVDSLGCDKSKLYDAEEGLQKLGEALNFAQTGRIESDIKELRELQMLAKKGMQEDVQVSFVQVHNLQYLYMLKHKFDSLALVELPNSFARHHIEGMRSQINLVLASTDTNTKKACCEMLFKMIEVLLLDLLELEEECSKPITINIEGEIRKIQIIRGQCDGVHSPTPVIPKEVTPQNVIPIQPPEKTLPPPPPPKEPTPKPKEPTPKPKEPTPKPKEPTPKPKTPTPPPPKEPTPKPKTPTPPPPKEPTPKVKTPTPPPKEPTPKPKTPTPTPVVVIDCVKGSNVVGDLSSSDEPTADSVIEGKDLGGASDYGYGFWIRWLSRYPEELLTGRTKDTYYFISRLTTNQNYKDVEMGDRVLAIWHYDTGYTFTTNDKASKNPNVNKNLATGDIEGLWSYVYFSYSGRLRKAVGLVKFGSSGKTDTVIMDVTHDIPTYLRLIVGGKQFNYPGFNGQFTSPVFKIGEGAYVNSELELFDYNIKCNPFPQVDCTERSKQTLVHKVVKYTQESKATTIKTSLETPFPEQYSVSGWFKWKQLEKQEPWHLLFRVFSNKENTNAKNLGDRDLGAWIGTANEGIILLATYSYNNLFGEGNPNILNQVQHKQRISDWTFVYFGYSFQEKKAHAIVHFKDVREERTFENVNHFLVQRLNINLGKDDHYPAWNGAIGKFRVDLCNGAYDPKFPRTSTPVPSPSPQGTPPPAKTEQPPPKTPTIVPPPKPIKPPTADIIKSPTPPPKEKTPDVIQKCIEGQGAIGDSSAANDAKPVADIKVPEDSLVGVNEYGYGFWNRWLTRYPEQLFNGMNEPWYFVSRLTSNGEYEDLRMGDRLLAIFLNKDGYTFVTNDETTQNANLNKQQAVKDIEGVWTFIHFSYSPSKNLATVFIQANQQVNQIEFSGITHAAPKQLRLVIGGNDLKKYPGFNGQFSRPILKIGPGSFIGTPEQLNKFALSCNPQPQLECQKDRTDSPLQEGVQQVNADKPTELFVADNDNPFPNNYGIGGWFLWKDIPKQDPWHLAFRVSQNGPNHNKNDQLLGDRDLTVFLSASGNYAFATYTYEDMAGKGNPNVYSSIEHHDQHKQWHYIYMAYSRDERKAVSILFTKDDRQVKLLDNVNHYLAKHFKIYLGKDSFYKGYNGFISQITFFTCKDAYNPEFKVGQTPEIPQAPKLPERKCINGQPQIGDLQSTGEQVVDLKVTEDKLNGVSEYGYGFWTRWLTRYPDVLLKGLSEPWYFISRLTSNEQYENINMGDRLLAIFLGQTGYTFVTNDVATTNANVVKQIPYDDIEGVWTYLHFSYRSGQAVGLIYTKSKTQTAVIEAKHEVPKFLRLVVGGVDLKLYPGFNGQISSPILKLGSGAFVNTEEEFTQFVLSCNPVPQPECQGPKTSKLIEGVKKYDSKQTDLYEHVRDENQLFPTMYSARGWFKWVDTKQEPWHLAYRVTINDQKTNKNAELLGDRTLAVWLGLDSQGIYAFATYTYENLFGKGQPNQAQLIKHENRHTQWHYITFEYNRDTRDAYGAIIFNDGKVDLKFPNINHYLVPTLRILIGKDQFYPSYNGYIADFTFNTCQDAFNPQFKPSDPPSLPKTPVIPVEPPQPKVEPTCQQGDETIIDSAYDDVKPLASIEPTAENLKDISQYGYSFWIRFLTRHPKPLYQGKNEAWYFLSRLTSNKEYQDVEKGDRLLAIWQGQGGYTFVTNDVKTNNFNVNKPIVYGDIEGVWTYVYFSYSNTNNKAVGFIKYSGQDPQSVSFDVTHDTPTYLKLIIGGSDLQKYPAFNGQITRAVFKIGAGTFLENEEQLTKFAIKCNPEPEIGCTKPIEQLLIPESKKYENSKTSVIEIASEPQAKFPTEYSISGWFKWKETKMEQWHLAFRLHINKEEENKNAERLGDRTLAAWVSPAQEGIYAFATYSYKDLNGAGDPNIAKVIPQKQQQTEWHFISYGYSRDKRQVSGFVQFKDRKEEILIENVNHFLVQQVYLNIGKDRFYPSWNGYIGKFRMNLCGGAFKPIFGEDNQPPAITPPPKPQPVETKEICLVNTKLVEVTKDNIKDVIDQLNHLDQIEEKTCFCTLPKQPTVLIELYGDELHKHVDNPVIQRLIAQNQVRVRI